MLSRVRIATLVLFLFSLVVALLLGEFLVRMFHLTAPPLNPSLFRQPHPLYHHSLIPNTTVFLTNPEYENSYAINSHGFRDDERSLFPSEERYRIVMVGDSFVEGVGLDFNFTLPFLLEQQLRFSYPHVEVLNMGVATFSPSLEYLLTKYVVTTFHPHLVIIVFHLGDVQDDFSYLHNADVRYDDYGDLVSIIPFPNSSPSFARRVTTWLTYHSRFFLFFGRGFKKFFSAPSQYNLEGLGNISTDKFFMMRTNVSAAYVNEHFESSAFYLVKAQRLLAERGIPAVVVTFPLGNQVNPSEWIEGRKAARLTDHPVYSTAPQELLRALLEEEGVTVIDVSHDFLQQAANLSRYPLYYTYDGHFTPQGALLFSESLAHHLRASFTPFSVTENITVSPSSTAV